MTAIQFLMNGIVEHERLSIYDSDRFDKLMADAWAMQKDQIKKAYEEGYDAAFHHEESNSEKYYIENSDMI